MCWNCCDCEVISAPGDPVTLQCTGFKNKKPCVAVMGRLTEHYRWCSHWSKEKIKAEEKRLLEVQKNGI